MQPILRNALAWVGLIAIMLPLGCGQGGSDPPNDSGGAPAGLLSFDQVSYTWTQDSSRFSRLWSRAHVETIRVAVLGDSQETSPGGKGYVYVPRLNYEVWRRYGNVPETFVAGYGSYGDGAPWGEWLLSGGTAAPGASPTRVPPERLLPGIWVAAHSSSTGNSNVNGQLYGQLTALRQDAVRVAPEAQVYTGGEYFCTGGPVRAEIFAATHPDSGEIRYVARPTDDSTGHNYFAPISAEGVLDMGLAAPSYSVKSGMTPLLPLAGHRYLQLELLGSSDAKLTDIAGVRFINQACSHGMVFQDFADGAYTTSDFLMRHWDAGAMFRALGFHAAILHLGANDAGQGVRAEEYQDRTERLIAMIRSWVGDASFPVVLMSDPYRIGLSPENQREFDRYAGTHFAIAQKDPNVLVINSRRLMHEIGWDEARPDRLALFLADDVHYTPQGAIELAAAEIATLLGL